MRRRAQAGLTLIEVMIASAVLVIMMSLAWRTISNTADSRKRFEQYEQRNHELRMAMGQKFEEINARARVDNYLAGTSQSPDRAPAGEGAVRQDAAVRPAAGG